MLVAYFVNCSVQFVDVSLMLAQGNEGIEGPTRTVFPIIPNSKESPIPLVLSHIVCVCPLMHSILLFWVLSPKFHLLTKRIKRCKRIENRSKRRHDRLMKTSKTSCSRILSKEHNQWNWWECWTLDWEKGQEKKIKEIRQSKKEIWLNPFTAKEVFDHCHLWPVSLRVSGRGWPHSHSSINGVGIQSSYMGWMNWTEPGVVTFMDVPSGSYVEDMDEEFKLLNSKH